MINNIVNENEFDHIHFLNEPMISSVTPHLCYRDIIRCGLVCTSWRQMVNHPSMWEYLLNRDWINIPSSVPQGLNAQQLYKQYASKFIHALEDASLVKIQEKVSKPAASLDVLKIYGDTLYSINANHTLSMRFIGKSTSDTRLGKITTALSSLMPVEGKVLHIYRPSNSFALQMPLMIAHQTAKNQIMFSSISMEMGALGCGEMYVESTSARPLHSYKCIKQIQENHEIFGDLKGQIAIQDTSDQIKPPEIIRAGTELEEDGITYLTIKNNEIYFGDIKGSVQMLNTANNQHLILGKHEAPITYLKKGPNILISATDSIIDTTIKIWSTENFKLIATLVADSSITFLKLKQSILFVGSSDAHMQMWNIQSYEPVQSLNEDQIITTLLFQKNSLLAGTEQGRIQEWAENKPKKKHLLTNRLPKLSLTNRFSKLSLKRKKK